MALPLLFPRITISAVEKRIEIFFWFYFITSYIFIVIF